MCKLIVASMLHYKHQLYCISNLLLQSNLNYKIIVYLKYILEVSNHRFLLVQSCLRKRNYVQ